jgi:hypothetical protein
MNEPRTHPFELVFGTIAEERFPAIRDATEGDRNLDSWLMNQVVVQLLADLRPDEGLGSAVDDFVLFVNASYLWWLDGRVTVSRSSLVMPVSEVMYIQVESRRIWVQLGDEEPHEPLDGWFVIPDGEVSKVVACLGVHPMRPGLSVLTAEGQRPTDWSRPDGSATFSPLMEGGDTAGLASIASSEELLLLAWGASLEENTSNDNDGPQGGSSSD